MDKEEIIENMMKYLGIDYTISNELYDFCENRNEIDIILRNIEFEKERKMNHELQSIYE